MSCVDLYFKLSYVFVINIKLLDLSSLTITQIFLYLLLTHFSPHLSFTEADYTLDDSYWNEESPVGELTVQKLNLYFDTYRFQVLLL